MSKFIEGDTVKVVKLKSSHGDPDEVLNMVGTVVDANDMVGVELDDFRHGHTCNQRAKVGRGWYFLAEQLEKVEPAAVVVPKFRVGTFVRVVKHFEDGWWPEIGSAGQVKKVKVLERGKVSYAVEFAGLTGGSRCGGSCAEGHGWYCSEEMLERVV